MTSFALAGGGRGRAASYSENTHDEELAGHTVDDGAEDSGGPGDDQWRVHAAPSELCGQGAGKRDGKIVEFFE